MVQPKRDTRRDGTLAPVKMFRTERQANFRKSVRKDVISTGKKAKDEERRRMEEYRKLCKKEGIVSKRLDDYDAQRTTAGEELDARLKEVDQDAALSNAEKRRRKFSLKQKLASTTVTEMSKTKRGSAITALERMQSTREASRQEAIAQREASEAQKRERIRERRQIQDMHKMKTRQGQPIMSGKVSALMSKIARSQKQ